MMKQLHWIGLELSERGFNFTLNCRIEAIKLYCIHYDNCYQNQILDPWVTLSQCHYTYHVNVRGKTDPRSNTKLNEPNSYATQNPKEAGLVKTHNQTDQH